MSDPQTQTAILIIDGKRYELPIIVGTEDERAIDIRNLRAQTGLITLDPGFGNTGSCSSKVTFIDGDKGILRYHGIPIEQLVQHSTFVETAYLLIHSRLPTHEQLSRFSSLLNEHSLIHEDMLRFMQHFPPTAHPMNILGTMVNALSSFYPHVDALSLEEDMDITATRLISKIRTLAAMSYKKSIGEPFVYPRKEYSYCQNFLNMLFSSPVREYHVDDDNVKALNMLLILHADHEQNCSTSVVRGIGSAQTNLYACVAGGISALWGKLHGGANQEVIEMLERIHRSGEDLQKFIDLAKDKSSKFRLAGFGHRVYKNYDPRAKVIKKTAFKVINKTAGTDPLLEIALNLEERVLQDDYFISRKLYPNVDFYSGILYKAMGIPTNMFTVMFAIGRMPGWIAHWKEMTSGADSRIARPRQVYVGRKLRDYVPLRDRA